MAGPLDPGHGERSRRTGDGLGVEQRLLARLWGAVGRDVRDAAGPLPVSGAVRGQRLVCGGP